MKLKPVFGLGFAAFGLVAFSQCSPERTFSAAKPSELQSLVEALSGAAQTGIAGLPGTIAERFSDNPSYEGTVTFLRYQYLEMGIESRILHYNPMDMFPYYKQGIEKTYRTYFQHLLPTFQTDFDQLCSGTLGASAREKVLARLTRVELTEAQLCGVQESDRVEFYISTSIEFTTNKTRTMLTNRNRATWENLVAVIPTASQSSGGEAGPRPLCVLGAHLDSVVRQGGPRGPILLPVTLAPGADDNASGTVGVLMLARSLKAWIQTTRPEVSCDLAFVHFSGEEEGLFGSLAYVHQQVEAPVKWMVNFDMIGFNGDPATRSGTSPYVFNVGYHAGFPSAVLSAFRELEAKDAGEAPKPNAARAVIVEQTDYLYSSDQISFWEAGIPALSVSEQACSEETCRVRPQEFFNPHLHTTADTSDKLDYGYMSAILSHTTQALQKALSR